MIMVMAKNSAPSKSNNKKMENNLPFIQTDFQSSGQSPSQSDLTTFERQVDCSRAVDLHGGAQIVRIAKKKKSKNRLAM